MEGIYIQTTQNVTIQYTPASVGERIVGYLIDMLVILAWIVIVVIVISASNPDTSNNDTFYILFLSIAMLPVMFYDLISELFLNGQTLGKRAMGTKVVMLDGTQPTLGAYLMRWIFRLIDITLFQGVVAFITVIVNGKGQRLGDIAAGTTVVKIKPPLDLDQITTVKVPDNYQVTFELAIELTDKDLTIIKKVLAKNDAELMTQAAQRIKEVLDVQSTLPNRAFLETIQQDFTYLANREE
jgi:uncharacterized RDD family membrane protein YckC